MKHSKSSVRCKTSRVAQLRFDEGQLTSFAGLAVVQQLLCDLNLNKRIARCFSHQTISPIYRTSTIVTVLVVLLLLGYRRIRHVKYIKDDPMVLRVLSVRQLPNDATISRQLASIDDRSVEHIERLQQRLVIEALQREQLARVTLDFDGSVIGTCRHAQGVARGFNSKKRGQRSYYPLYCTVAQTAQVLAVAHRSGNVHDSNGAIEFIDQCIKMVQKARPNAIIEVRMDGAFFSERIIDTLNQHGVEYAISVPFERYATIRRFIDERRRWINLNHGRSYFQRALSLNAWSISKQRFVFVRQRHEVQHTGPLQLDLFLPRDFNYQYKVIVTNKTCRAARVIDYHQGRGSQEGLFAELKTQLTMDYVPCNLWNSNKTFLLSAIMAHNLVRELQMRHNPRERNTTTKRPALWKFSQIDTLRKTLFQRAARLIRPQGVLTLAMSDNDAVRNQFTHYLPHCAVAT